MTKITSLENVVLEYSDHLHEHFVDRLKIENAKYRLPVRPGYSITMHEKSISDYAFPDGAIWKERR